MRADIEGTIAAIQKLERILHQLQCRSAFFLESTGP
jgi:hypothetical protein